MKSPFKPARAWPVRAARKLRRYPVSTTLTAVLLIGLFATAAVLWWTDSKRPLWTMERDLHEHKAITLIGEQGAPKWQQIVAGSASSQASVPPQRKEFTISSWEDCFLELLPDPMTDTYRFSAEVRHLDSVFAGRVGLYLLGGAVDTTQGRELYICEVRFSDHTYRPGADNPPLTNLDVSLRRHAEDPRTPRTPSQAVRSSISRPFTPALVKFEADVPWRRIAVDVTPDGVEIHWEGQSVGSLSWQELERHAAKLSASEPAIDGVGPRFSPRGSLGLLVSESTAAFRNVKVDPLPK